jgi:uncharacterized C2H2 Zn-finger protein
VTITDIAEPTDVPVFVVDRDDSDIPEEKNDDGSVVCPECTRIFDTRSGLNRHLTVAHNRPDLHQKGAPRPRQQRKSSVVDVDYTGEKPSRTTDQTGKNVKAVKRGILQSFNPGLCDVIVATSGLPRELLDMPGVIPNTTLRKELTFSDLQAEILAQGIVRMNGTPAAITATKIVGPILPYAFGMAALAVVVSQVVKIFALRDMMAKVLEVAQGRGQESSDGAPGNSTRYV